LEYAGIVGVAVFVIWDYSAGKAGDLPFQLWLVPCAILTIAAGSISGHGAFRACVRRGDARGDAVAWGLFAAFAAPLLSVGITICYVTFCYAVSSQLSNEALRMFLFLLLLPSLASGFVLGPLLALYLRGVTGVLYSEAGASEEQKATIRNRLRPRLIALSVIVVGVAALHFYQTGLATRTPGLAEIKGTTLLELPPDSRLVASRLYTQGGRFFRLLAKVEVNRGDVHELVRGFSSAGVWQVERSRSSRLYILKGRRGTPFPPWFDPDRPRDFVAVTLIRKNRSGRPPCAVDMLFDLTGSGRRVIVYIARYG
jgi:hypothetical protein